ncbi:MAG TPA: hypothetical protein VJ817_14095 [Gemmatimonadales bacterium]|nr:hypothetical protein [Gemmatimonadales bacterium]
MTDRDEERIDLSALGGPDPLQENSVVRGAMLRIRAAPAREPLLAALAAWWRPGLAAAILVFALGIFLARERSRLVETGPEPVEARLIDWVLAGRVPSNGELLATFQGYSR